MAKTQPKGESLPVPARKDPTSYLAELGDSAIDVAEPEVILHRLDLIRAVAAYQQRYAKEAEPVLRRGLATRLQHERRLGDILAGTVDHTGGGDRRSSTSVLRDDTDLPDGVSRNLSSTCQTLASTPKRWFEKVIAAVLDGSRRMSIKEIYLEARRIVAGEKSKGDLPSGLIHGDFQEEGSRIGDESVALILTDPPYDAGSLHLYEAVAGFGARVLAPGGSLIVYAPHYAFPRLFKDMCPHLRFCWPLVVLHTGQRALMPGQGVRVGYKPLLWFTKTTRWNPGRVISDVIEGEMEKTEHEWQQAVSEAQILIEALTAPDDLVLDPMTGSGTTLLAAQECGRRWCGIDTDKGALEIAAERLKKGAPQ